MIVRKNETVVLLLFLLLGLTAWPRAAAAQGAEESCVTCHGGLGGPLAEPVEAYAGDVHAEEGFGCVACHGGDAQEMGMGAMDPAVGYIGVPEHRDIPMVCGRCHSSAQFMRQYNPSLRVDQVAEFRTSIHGRDLFERDDQRVATCASCHPAHSIKPPSDPTSSVNPLNVSATCSMCHADEELMAPYGHPTDQHEEYEKSVHWHMLSEEGDLSAPTCNDCHGNHGAAPPGISWVGNVCGQCHMVMGELFTESLHSQTFAMLGNPGCATCHSNHGVQLAGDELLGVGEGAACGMCHVESDGGGQVATEMRVLIDSLRVSTEQADSILSRAENAGMEVSQAQFDLSGAITALVSARTAVHSFSVDAVREEVDAGLEISSGAQARGQGALEELQFRRMGLAVSVSIILVLIVGLVLTIRLLERRAGMGPAATTGSEGQ
jgi:hypothetical protein